MVEKQRENKMLGGVTGKGFMPGKSGNPAGRPPGQSLKEFARQYLADLSPEAKEAWIADLPPEIVWRMAEGNPAQDVTSKGERLPAPILYVPSDDSAQEDKTAE